jgi:hypothetical protein
MQQQFFISFANKLKKKQKKVKDPAKVADAFDNLFLITENVNTHHAGKQYAITLLKDSFQKIPCD